MIDAAPPAAPREPWPLRAIDSLSNGAVVLAAVAMGLMVVVVTADVVGRSFLGRPVPGALEFTAWWFMPTMILLAMAAAERTGDHIRVTLLLDRLPPAPRRAAEAVFSLLAAGLLATLAWHALAEALHGAALRRTTASTPPVPIWPFAFVAVAGLAVLALQCLASAWRRIAGTGA